MSGNHRSDIVESKVEAKVARAHQGHIMSCLFDRLLQQRGIKVSLPDSFHEVCMGRKSGCIKTRLDLFMKAVAPWFLCDHVYENRKHD